MPLTRRRVLNTAVAALAAEAVLTRATLRGATLTEEGDTAVLHVPPDFLAMARMHADEYKDLARKASGRPLSVRIEAGGSAAPEGGAAPPEQSKERLHEEAARQPAVKEMLDLFGGRIVDVREAKEERP